MTRLDQHVENPQLVEANTAWEGGGHSHSTLYYYSLLINRGAGAWMDPLLYT